MYSRCAVGLARGSGEGSRNSGENRNKDVQDFTPKDPLPMD